MNWEQGRERPCETMEIDDVVSRLLQNFDYEAIVPQPTKSGGCMRKTHVKRPMNAFMVFAQVMRKRLSEQQPHAHNAELSKTLGSMWKNLDEATKQPFIKQADKLRTQHKREYPDYKYQPRRRKPPQAATARLKREPSPERTHIDFSRIEVDSALLADGPPDGAELEQYLKPVPDYHELQPRYLAHTQHTPPSLYGPLPSHIHPSCAEWQHYTTHSSGMP